MAGNAGAAYRLGWLSVLAGAVLAVATLFASGMRPVMASVLPLLLLALLLGCAHVVYGRFRPNPRLSLVPGLLAMLILSGLFAAIISHAGLRLGRPLVDPALSAADGWLGIDTPRLALALGRGGAFWGNVLSAAYVSSFPVVFCTALWLGGRCRYDRAWELAFSFAFCIIAASLIYLCFPALDSMVHHHVAGTPGLPSGAGDYHLAAVEYFRNGSNPAFDLKRISGVVTFPSFHMVMALMVPYALRRTGFGGWIALAWSVPVIAATIVIGGHYVVDLIGGSLLWGGALWMARFGGSFMAPAREARRPEARALSS